MKDSERTSMRFRPVHLGRYIDPYIWTRTPDRSKLSPTFSLSTLQLVQNTFIALYILLRLLDLGRVLGKGRHNVADQHHIGHQGRNTTTDDRIVAEQPLTYKERQ